MLTGLWWSLGVRVRPFLSRVRERRRREAAVRQRREEAIRAHRERFKPTVMVIDRSSLTGRFIERHTDGREASVRMHAINAAASEDLAFTVVTNVDGWSRTTDPESMYKALLARPGAIEAAMGTALDNGQRSPRKLLASVVRRLVLALKRS
jgi:hypothetical protein